MNRTLKIGILRETRKPPDRRVPLTPQQIISFRKDNPHAEFYIQPCEDRCYSDKEYADESIPLQEDLSICDLLLGVKEVDPATFIHGKKYLFFAHVGKKQPHNLTMFREMAERSLTLIDYEYLTTEKGDRILAFGRWAGIVGAYNGLRAYGLRTKKFDLRPANKCQDVNDMWQGLKHIKLEPGLKILLTGEGRVANGAAETLKVCNIKKVLPDDYLKQEYDTPVFCQIGPDYYTKHKSSQQFNFANFVSNPGDYESAILPFANVTDILITGHYWDPGSPLFFTRDDMIKQEFRISVIADISCDVNGPIPSTLRASTIENLFYDYNPLTGAEEPAFRQPGNITVMAVDNLPGELPRDASVDFGNQLMNNVLKDLISETESPVIERATILKDGRLTPAFEYLSDYLREKNI